MFSFFNKGKNTGGNPASNVTPVPSSPSQGTNPSIKKGEKEPFIQLFNAEGDTVFVGLSSGTVSWKLPDNSTLKDVKYFSHINDDDGRLYFEESKTGTVSWSLPLEDQDVSISARKIISQLDNMSREDTEKLVGQSFSEDITNYVNDAIDQFLDEKDKVHSHVEAEQSNPPQSGAPRSFPKNQAKPIHDEYYLQSFNRDGDPVFVGLKSGIAYWTLPDTSLFDKVRMFGHINDDDGRIYFEDVEDGKVTWSLEIDNKIVFELGYETVSKIDNLSRDETEEFLQSEYNEEEIQQQNEALDNFLEEKEEKKKIEKALQQTKAENKSNINKPPSSAAPVPPVAAPPGPAPAVAATSNPTTTTAPLTQNRQPFQNNKTLDTDEESEPDHEAVNDDDENDGFVEKEVEYYPDGEQYIQSFNYDGDTIIIGITSGYAYWLLPKNLLEKIVIFTHVNESDGKLYFENSITGEVTWSLPDRIDKNLPIPASIKGIIESFDNFSRLESEIFIGQRFNEELTANQNEEIEILLESKDNERKLKEEKEKNAKQLIEEKKVAEHKAVKEENRPLPTPPTAVVTPKKEIDEKFMQSFNVEGDTVLIGLLTGKLFWSLPEKIPLEKVVYLTHLSDDGRIYFEDVASGEFLWSPPAIQEGFISLDAHHMIVSIEPMTRQETEQLIGTPFNANVTNNFNELLENHLLKLDELKKSKTSEKGDNNSPQRRTSFNHFNGETSSALQSLQESLRKESVADSEEGGLSYKPATRVSVLDEPLVIRQGKDLRASVVQSGYLKKQATQSGRNWKKRWIVLTNFTISYYETEKQFTSNARSKGEITMTSDMECVIFTTPGEGFGFKVFSKSNSSSQIIFAALNDVERKKWMDKIKSVILKNKSFLKSNNFQFINKLPNATPEKLYSLGIKIIKSYEVKKFFLLCKDYLFCFKEEMINIEWELPLDGNIMFNVILHKENANSNEISGFLYLVDTANNNQNYILAFHQSNIYEFNVWKDAIHKYTKNIQVFDDNYFNILQQHGNITDEKAEDNSNKAGNRTSLARLSKAIDGIFSLKRNSSTEESKPPADLVPSSTPKKKTRQSSLIRASIRQSITTDDASNNPGAGALHRPSLADGADALAMARARKAEKQKSIKLQSKSILITKRDSKASLWDDWGQSNGDEEQLPTTDSMKNNLSDATLTESQSQSNTNTAANAAISIPLGEDKPMEVKKSRKASFTSNGRKSVHFNTDGGEDGDGARKVPINSPTVTKTPNFGSPPPPPPPPLISARIKEKEPEPSATNNQPKDLQSQFKVPPGPPKRPPTMRGQTPTELEDSQSITSKTSNNSNDVNFEKFEKMSQLLPEGAVRQKMQMEGISSEQIDSFFKKMNSKNTVSPSIPATKPQSSAPPAIFSPPPPPPPPPKSQPATASAAPVPPPPPPPGGKAKFSLADMKKKAMEKVNSEKDQPGKSLTNAELQAEEEARGIPPPTGKQSILSRSTSINSINTVDSERSNSTSTSKNALEMAAARKSKKMTQSPLAGDQTSLKGIFGSFYAPEENAETILSPPNPKRASINRRKSSIKPQPPMELPTTPVTEPIKIPSNKPEPSQERSSTPLSRVFGSDNGDDQSKDDNKSIESRGSLNAIEMMKLRKQRKSTDSLGSFSSKRNSSDNTPSQEVKALHNLFGTMDLEKADPVVVDPPVTMVAETKGPTSNSISRNSNPSINSLSLPEEEESTSDRKLNALEAAKLRKKLKDSSASIHAPVRNNNAEPSQAPSLSAVPATNKSNDQMNDFYRSYNKSKLLALEEFLNDPENDKIPEPSKEQQQQQQQASSSPPPLNVTQNTLNVARRASELKEKRRNSLNRSMSVNSPDTVNSTTSSNPDEKKKTSNSSTPVPSAAASIFGALEASSDSEPEKSKKPVGMATPAAFAAVSVENKIAPTTTTGIRDAAKKNLARRPSVTMRQQQQQTPPNIVEQNQKEDVRQSKPETSLFSAASLLAAMSDSEEDNDNKPVTKSLSNEPQKPTESNSLFNASALLSQLSDEDDDEEKDTKATMQNNNPIMSANKPRQEEVKKDEPSRQSNPGMNSLFNANALLSQLSDDDDDDNQVDQAKEQQEKEEYLLSPKTTNALSSVFGLAQVSDDDDDEEPIKAKPQEIPKKVQETAQQKAETRVNPLATAASKSNAVPDPPTTSKSPLSALFGAPNSFLADVSDDSDEEKERKPSSAPSTTVEKGKMETDSVNPIAKASSTTATSKSPLSTIFGGTNSFLADVSDEDEAEEEKRKEETIQKKPSVTFKEEIDEKNYSDENRSSMASHRDSEEKRIPTKKSVVHEVKEDDDEVQIEPERTSHVNDFSSLLNTNYHTEDHFPTNDDYENPDGTRKKPARIAEEIVDSEHSPHSPIHQTDPSMNNSVTVGGAYVNAIDLFKVHQNKPLVKMVFENYSYHLKIDVTSFQQFSYDFGYFMTTEEIVLTLKQYSTAYSRFTANNNNHKNNQSVDDYLHLSYEDFLIFWRNHPVFSAMKVNDSMTKRRLQLAAMFKEHDKLSSGNIKLSGFQQLYQKLGETNYLNPKRHKIKDILNYADPYHKGKVDMNRFIEWMNNNVNPSSNQSSTFSRIWSSLSGSPTIHSTGSSPATITDRKTTNPSPSSLSGASTGNNNNHNNTNNNKSSQDDGPKIKKDPYKDDLWNPSSSSRSSSLRVPEEPIAPKTRSKPSEGGVDVLEVDLTSTNKTKNKSTSSLSSSKELLFSNESKAYDDKIAAMQTDLKQHRKSSHDYDHEDNKINIIDDIQLDKDFPMPKKSSSVAAADVEIDLTQISKSKSTDSMINNEKVKPRGEFDFLPIENQDPAHAKALSEDELSVNSLGSAAMGIKKESNTAAGGGKKKANMFTRRKSVMKSGPASKTTKKEEVETAAIQKPTPVAMAPAVTKKSVSFFGAEEDGDSGAGKSAAFLLSNADDDNDEDAPSQKPFATSEPPKDASTFSNPLLALMQKSKPPAVAPAPASAVVPPPPRPPPPATNAPSSSAASLLFPSESEKDHSSTATMNPIAKMMAKKAEAAKNGSNLSIDTNFAGENKPPPPPPPAATAAKPANAPPPPPPPPSAPSLSIAAPADQNKTPQKNAAIASSEEGGFSRKKSKRVEYYTPEKYNSSHSNNNNNLVAASSTTTPLVPPLPTSPPPATASITKPTSPALQQPQQQSTLPDPDHSHVESEEAFYLLKLPQQDFLQSIEVKLSLLMKQLKTNYQEIKQFNATHPDSLLESYEKRQMEEQFVYEKEIKEKREKEKLAVKENASKKSIPAASKQPNTLRGTNNNNNRKNGGKTKDKHRKEVEEERVVEDQQVPAEKKDFFQSFLEKHQLLPAPSTTNNNSQVLLDTKQQQQSSHTLKASLHTATASLSSPSHAKQSGASQQSQPTASTAGTAATVPDLSDPLTPGAYNTIPMNLFDQSHHQQQHDHHRSKNKKKNHKQTRAPSQHTDTDTDTEHEADDDEQLEEEPFARTIATTRKQHGKYDSKNIHVPLTTALTSSTTISSINEYQQLLQERQMLLESINYLHYFYLQSKEKLFFMQLSSYKRIIEACQSQLQYALQEKQTIESLYQTYLTEIQQENEKLINKEKQIIYDKIACLKKIYLEKEYQIYSLILLLKKKNQDLITIQEQYQSSQLYLRQWNQEISSLSMIPQDIPLLSSIEARKDGERLIIPNELKINENIAIHREQRQFQDLHRKEQLSTKVQKIKQQLQDKAMKRKQRAELLAFSHSSFDQLPRELQESGDAGDEAEPFDRDDDDDDEEDEDDENVELLQRDYDSDEGRSSTRRGSAMAEDKDQAADDGDVADYDSDMEAEHYSLGKQSSSHSFHYQQQQPQQRPPDQHHQPAAYQQQQHHQTASKSSSLRQIGSWDSRDERSITASPAISTSSLSRSSSFLSSGIVRR